jgi:hypothetical protein
MRSDVSDVLLDPAVVGGVGGVYQRQAYNSR